MNHSTAINELTIIRDIQLNNASVAHAEGRHDDRDRRLDKANCLSATIRELQGIREPELPGLGSGRKINPFLDRALEELTRDAWNSLGKPRVLAVGEMPAPRNPDFITRVSYKIATLNTRDVVEEWREGADSPDRKSRGYLNATAHIFLDEPQPTAQP